MLLYNALTSTLVLRCDCDLRSNVAAHARPRKVRQGPPRDPRRHPGVVVRHKTGFTDDAVCRVPTTLRYAAKRGHHAGNLCCYGRNSSQQQRRVRDERSHQDLREPSHQVSSGNTGCLSLRRANTLFLQYLCHHYSRALTRNLLAPCTQPESIPGPPRTLAPVPSSPLQSKALVYQSLSTTNTTPTLR